MEFLDAETVADRLGVTGQTVRRWIRQGHIAAYELPSGRYRITEEQLQAFLIPVTAESSDEGVSSTADSPDSDVLFDRDWQAEG